ARIATVSANIGTGRVIRIAVIPHCFINISDLSYSGVVTSRLSMLLPARPMPKQTREAPSDPIIESIVPINTPKSAPFAVIIILEGTGNHISATSSTTPMTAGKTPLELSHSDGSANNGTLYISATPNSDRKKKEITSTIIQ